MYYSLHLSYLYYIYMHIMLQKWKNTLMPATTFGKSLWFLVTPNFEFKYYTEQVGTKSSEGKQILPDR